MEPQTTTQLGELQNKTYRDCLLETKNAGIVPPSLLSQAVMELGDIHSKLVNKKTRLAIACDLQREELMKKTDPSTAKPMTGTKADSIVASSKEGQELSEINDLLGSNEHLIKCLQSHQTSMLKEWANEPR